jgi:hypothetical protein
MLKKIIKEKINKGIIMLDIISSLAHNYIKEISCCIVENKSTVRTGINSGLCDIRKHN